MNRSSYYRRLMSKALQNVTSRTGWTVQTTLYVVLSFVAGAVIYNIFAGPEKLLEQLEPWFFTTAAGTIVALLVVLLFSTIAAPYDIHLEDYETHQKSIDEALSEMRLARQERDGTQRRSDEMISQLNAAQPTIGVVLDRIETFCKAGQQLLNGANTTQEQSDEWFRELREYVDKLMFSRFTDDLDKVHRKGMLKGHNANKASIGECMDLLCKWKVSPDIETFLKPTTAI